MKYWIYFEPRVCDEIELSDESELGLIDIYDDEQNLIEEGSFIYKGVAVRSDKKGGYSDGYYDYHILKNPPKGYELETLGDWENVLEFKSKKDAVNWIKKIPSISYKDNEKFNESSSSESVDDIISYYPNGNKEEEVLVGEFNIEVTKWYSDGKKKEISYYKKEPKPLVSNLRIKEDFIKIGIHKDFDSKGKLIKEIDYDSHFKKTDKEVNNILTEIESKLKDNLYYEIIKSRGRIMLDNQSTLQVKIKNSHIEKNYKNNIKIQMEFWIDRYYEEYCSEGKTKKDSFVFYDNYLEIHNIIKKYINSFNVNDKCSKSLKNLLYLNISSYSSLEGIKKYIGLDWKNRFNLDIKILFDKLINNKFLVKKRKQL